MRAIALLLACALAGCAHAPRIAELAPAPPEIELTGTPFFPDSGTLCGPAALATVLQASGVRARPAELESALYVPGRRGTLQAEIVSAARRHGRVPYPLAGGMRELLATVAAGRPVLVLQNLGLGFWPAWHYAVVVGYDGADDTLILRSGTSPRERVPLRIFRRRWDLAKDWAIAVAPPTQPPAPAEPVRWLQAAAAFEELGQPAVAESAYAAATDRWPEQPLAWQMLANAQHAQGKLEEAELALREALRLEESAASLNNLAQVLADRGCAAAARSLITRAATLARSPDEAAVIQRTGAAIAPPASEPPGCPAPQASADAS